MPSKDSINSTASNSAKHEEQASSKRSAPTSVQPEQTPVEPEDARLIGANKQRQHELLKENVEQGKAERHPDLPAGLHATGSFTGENKERK